MSTLLAVADPDYVERFFGTMHGRDAVRAWITDLMVVRADVHAVLDWYVVKGRRVILSMQNRYEGPLENFALVVPVPQVLMEANVKTLDPAVFDKIDTLTSPRLVEYWEQDPCNPSYPYDDVQAAADGGANNANFATPADGTAPRFAHVCWRREYRHGLAFQDVFVPWERVFICRNLEVTRDKGGLAYNVIELMRLENDKVLEHWLTSARNDDAARAVGARHQGYSRRLTQTLRAMERDGLITVVQCNPFYAGRFDAGAWRRSGFSRGTARQSWVEYMPNSEIGSS